MNVDVFQPIPPRTWTVLLREPSVALWHDADGVRSCRVEDGKLAWGEPGGVPDNWCLQFVGPGGRGTAPIAGWYGDIPRESPGTTATVTFDDVDDPPPTAEVWAVARTSCRCGGDWAWMRQRPSGAWESRGCVCHSDPPPGNARVVAP